MIILWLWKEINLSIFLWFFSSAKAGSGFFPVNFNSPAILIKTKAVFQRFSTSFPSRPTTTTSRMALSASRGMMRGLVARGRQFCTSRSSKAVVNPEVRKANFDRLVTHANFSLLLSGFLLQLCSFLEQRQSRGVVPGRSCTDCRQFCLVLTVPRKLKTQIFFFTYTQFCQRENKKQDFPPQNSTWCSVRCKVRDGINWLEWK